jgi:hypothetical protein
MPSSQTADEGDVKSPVATIRVMSESVRTNETVARAAHSEAADDLAELEFSPLTPEEAAEVDDRVYLLGVRREYQNIR